MKFEYSYTEYRSYDETRCLSTFNALGAEGWEIIGIVALTENHGSRLLAKREIREDTPDEH